MLNLNQQLKRVEIKEFEIENQIVFNYFDNLPASERDEKLLRAIYIGVLALMEDRISAFLSKTTNELGTELESLKMIFEMKKELFYKSTIKGVLAEDEIADFLNRYFQEKKLKDKAFLTGNTAGSIPKNKTGDIICEIDGKSNLKIAIECKFDKSIRFGEIESKEIFTRKTDTAWSQLIEAQANRDAQLSAGRQNREVETPVKGSLSGLRSTQDQACTRPQISHPPMRFIPFLTTPLAIPKTKMNRSSSSM